MFEEMEQRRPEMAVSYSMQQICREWSKCQSHVHRDYLEGMRRKGLMTPEQSHLHHFSEKKMFQHRYLRQIRSIHRKLKLTDSSSEEKERFVALRCLNTFRMHGSKHPRAVETVLFAVF